MDKSKKLQRASLAGSLMAVLTASLCCVGPLVAVTLGIGGLAFSAILEKWRPALLVLTFALLGLAWYLTYRRGGARQEDSASQCPPASPGCKLALWSTTALTVILSGVPVLSSTTLCAGHGASCCAAEVANGQDNISAGPAAESAPRPIPPGLVSLYQVPLVCPAAHQIGCGSHAKPILLALQQQPAVSEAWLNRSGTIMAVVWKAKTNPADRAAALDLVTRKEGLEATELRGTARDRALKDFLSGQTWYRGEQVDRLSQEEARIIAARLVKRIQAQVPVSDDKAKMLRTELEDLLKGRLTGTHPPEEPSAQAAVFKILQAHFDEKDLAVLRQTLPRNARPLPGEQ